VLIEVAEAFVEMAGEKKGDKSNFGDLEGS
jgi:hypothetical protein